MKEQLKLIPIMNVSSIGLLKNTPHPAIPKYPHGLPPARADHIVGSPFTRLNHAMYIHPVAAIQPTMKL